MSYLNELIEKKGKDWVKVINHANEIMGRQGMQSQDFVLLVDACTRPEQLAMLAREFFRFSQMDSQKRSGYQVFIKEVDDSDYELRDWIQALECLFHWLEENKKSTDFLTSLRYLNCCAQAPDNQLFHHALKDITVQMLSDYGMELAKDISDD